jgi:hypothetical protein
LIEDVDGLRPSRCLELPLAAPDCIQPLFAGHDDAALADAIARKAEFVRSSGGCHIALVHAGVFGPADAERRLEHLRDVRRHLRHPDVWLTSIDEIAAWWRQREGLEVRIDADTATITNTGSEAVHGVRLVVEDRGGSISIEAPALAPGESFTADTGRRQVVGAA